MTTPRWRYATVNTFGVLGYLSGILQWVWTAIVLCYPIVTMDRSTLFLEPSRPAPAATADLGALSPLVIIAAIITTILVLVLTAITLIKLPKTIGTSGAKTTHTIAAAIIPTVTHHKQLSKKRYVRLSYRIIIGLKFLMAVLALVLLAFAPPIPALSQKIILTVGAIGATFTLLYFSLQALLAQILRVDKKNVW